MRERPRILVTVGTQLPFDRLVGAVAAWHRKRQAAEITFQIGASGIPQEMFAGATVHESIETRAFSELFEASDLVVAHAGMGTIISTAEVGKPIVIMPRRASFGEHRNDHQLATAAEMTRLSNVTCAMSEAEMPEALDRFMESWQDNTPNAATLGPHAEPALLAAVRAFIFDKGH